MRCLFTQSPNCGKSESDKKATQADVAGKKREKTMLIPVELDITRTKEFWDKAVLS